MDDQQAQALEWVHAQYGPVDARVDQLLRAIRTACEEKQPAESFNRSNERLAEAFAASLEAGFPGKVVIQRQRLSSWAIRTTRWNYLFTVPGESPDRIILVAHYDTWRGPGADDNTTGEEILKQYLLSDLWSGRQPRLTHTYFLAGSEECGLIGLTSQILLALGLLAANLAVAERDWLWAAAALATAPLSGYRFGVSGSREYVKTLNPEDIRRIRAVVAVDSVGEGRLYLPRGTMGADFIHTLIPFGDYDSLNDLLEEGAHLHGIKYNNYLAGGTTDHLSFLEVHNGLWYRAREAVRRAWARWSRSSYTPPVRIPASALVAMLPGKASPLVFGGKIHTPNDTPDRVYPQPLRESLQVLDYFFYRMEGGERMREPRTLDEYHYARLYRVDGGHLLVLKDAVEHNRRNVNGVYRAKALVEGKRATVEVGEIVTWGVHPRLRDQVAEVCAQRGWTWRRERVDEMSVSGEGLHLRFERRLNLWQRLAKSVHRWTADVDGFIKDWTFASYFILAYLLGQMMDVVLSGLFLLWPASAVWFLDHATLCMVVIVILELAVLVYLMARRIPTWVDNAYRHENRADNLGSLRRVPSR